ncbi:hypothetical protein [Geoglobus acetivorans]|uniref:Uncharacterized protein n=1 Tax=Geoglobus acetivorans TaxID=565033 RepID=A0A0A7GJJ1_GEOAI|nr:hypothetical protein GACE_2110 [Geoglobus acetivorans]
MAEIQIIILRDGEEIYKAKFEGEVRAENPILSYDEDSYEELVFSEDLPISAIHSVLETFADFLIER